MGDREWVLDSVGCGSGEDQWISGTQRQQREKAGKAEAVTCS